MDKPSEKKTKNAKKTNDDMKYARISRRGLKGWGERRSTSYLS